MLSLLVCLWGNHLHYGVDQNVVKYTLLEVLFPFRVVGGLTPRASALGMMGKVLAVGCQCRGALCQTQLGLLLH